MSERSVGSQFVHLEHYSRKASLHPRSKKGRADVQFIVDEMLRVPAASGHVPHPKPPVLLYGSRADIEALPARLREGAARCVDKIGRRQRSDTPLLMGVIFSFPSGTVTPEYLAWERDTVKFSLQKFGARTAAIVRHEDETFLHIHVQVHNHGRSVHHVSPGYSNGKRSRAALKGFQDLYQEQVARLHGLARIGPRRERQPSTRKHKLIQAELAAAQSVLEGLQVGAKKLWEEAELQRQREERRQALHAKTKKALAAETTELQRVMAQRSQLEVRRAELEKSEMLLAQKTAAMDAFDRARIEAEVSALRLLQPRP